MIFNATSASAFSKAYLDDWENNAHSVRGEFLAAFPEQDIKRLTLKRYAIGGGDRTTFCYRLEVGTKDWALVSGATAHKFGVYFGRTKTDSKERFRYTEKFAKGLSPIGHEQAAFHAVKTALLDLIDSGRDGNFNAIDKNPLSQMMKAKILSLYFPDKYLNICDQKILQDLSDVLNLGCNSPSECQSLLIEKKRITTFSMNWSNLKFMAFLFRAVLEREAKNVTPPNDLDEPKKKVIVKKRKKVDFNALQEKWKTRGEASEKFAFEFEKNRLLSLRLQSSTIHDRREYPSYGYDYESWTAPGVRRYIEVKSFSRGQFYLSKNEHEISLLASHRKEYYFYLVEYEKDTPVRVDVQRASEVYRVATLTAVNFLVTFE